MYILCNTGEKTKIQSSQTSWALGKKRPGTCSEGVCGHSFNPGSRTLPAQGAGSLSSPRFETQEGLKRVAFPVLKLLPLWGLQPGSGGPEPSLLLSLPGLPPCALLGRCAGVQGGSREGAGRGGRCGAEASSPATWTVGPAFSVPKLDRIRRFPSLVIPRCPSCPCEETGTAVTALGFKLPLKSC